MAFLQALSATYYFSCWPITGGIAVRCSKVVLTIDLICFHAYFAAQYRARVVQAKTTPSWGLLISAVSICACAPLGTHICARHRRSSHEQNLILCSHIYVAFKQTQKSTDFFIFILLLPMIAPFLEYFLRVVSTPFWTSSVYYSTGIAHMKLVPVL